MTLTLSATDLSNLREAIAVFASPFASESAAKWIGTVIERHETPQPKGTMRRALVGGFIT